MSDNTQAVMGTSFDPTNAQHVAKKITNQGPSVIPQVTSPAQDDEINSRLEQQELIIAELLTWLREYYPNMGYTPELREQEYTQLLDNIRRISKGQQPVRRKVEDEDKDKSSD